jgi:protein-tyrosine phosphatase
MEKVVVSYRLSFGGDKTCSVNDDGSLAVVHACRIPCHRRAVGYKNDLADTHPNYLVREKGHHLYLNLIDSPQPLFKLASFEAFLGFVDREIRDRPVHVHCNQGESRAPSLALLYMAKRLKTLPARSYREAAAAFRERFPYNPGEGIETWLIANWRLL